MYEMKNLNQKTGLVLLILAILIYIGMALWFDFTQDDAYITFRYAANFVDGHGLVFNIGERVEGYTNFLWTIFMILGLKAGFNLILFSKILGVICGAAAICMLYLLAGLIPALRSIWRGAACLIAGTAYSFAYWSVAGLETAAFALAVIASIYFYCRGNYLAAPILVLATLLRPEGGLVFAFIIVFDLISARRITDFVITTAGIYILSLIPFLAFKYFYFGGFFPTHFMPKPILLSTNTMTVSNTPGGFSGIIWGPDCLFFPRFICSEKGIGFSGLSSYFYLYIQFTSFLLAAMY